MHLVVFRLQYYYCSHDCTLNIVFSTSRIVVYTHMNEFQQARVCARVTVSCVQVRMHMCA
jgi:hypothetical protein